MVYQRLLSKISNSMLGSELTEKIVADKGKLSLKKIRKHRRRLKRIKREFRQRKTHLKNLHGTCVRHIQPVTAPLALISQIQRSGGSLLSQLFDGHPQVHAHPHELKIGYPTKYTWPELDLNKDPSRWFEILFEPSVIGHFEKGYKKQRNMDETFLFLFLPSVQKQLFLSYLDSVKAVTRRDILNAYMTSYFGAWLNNQNMYGEKKFITAFTARLAMEKANVQSFFEIYPDGQLISIIRDPRNWYPSAANHKPSIYGDIETALGLWQKNARSMLWNKEHYGQRVCILNFEDLINRTEAVMRYLAEWLKLEFDDCLLLPTFNKCLIRANTSFKARKPGIIGGTLDRYKSLSREQLGTIERMTADLYREVLRVRAEIT